MSRAYKTMFGLGPYVKGEKLVFLLRDRGVESFNAARARWPTWRPDFGSSSLKGLELSQVNLQMANLKNANLEGVVIDNLEMTDERARKVLARRKAIVE